MRNKYYFLLPRVTVVSPIRHHLPAGRRLLVGGAQLSVLQIGQTKSFYESVGNCVKLSARRT